MIDLCLGPIGPFDLPCPDPGGTVYQVVLDVSMSPPWQFVSSQPYGSTVNPETRKLVRETAMRSFRRRQRLQGIVDFRRQQAQAKAGGDRSSQANSATSTAGTSSHCADVQGTILEEWANEDGFALHEQMALVMNGPGAVLDPFNQTALYNQHDAPRLFMHCKRSIWWR